MPIGTVAFPVSVTLVVLGSGHAALRGGSGAGVTGATVAAVRRGAAVDVSVCSDGRAHDTNVRPRPRPRAARRARVSLPPISPTIHNPQWLLSVRYVLRVVKNVTYDRTFLYSYEPTHMNAAPYLVGLLFGYIYHCFKPNKKAFPSVSGLSIEEQIP